MSDPLLVASADGVGTKVKVAIAAGIHGTVGQDLVNHCVNDILVQGASPLFFLDYIATGKMRPEIVGEILEGLAKACRENGCALLGGETAEMPGMYAAGDYDLAGTIVGVVDRPKLLDGSKVSEGDLLIGLPSSGLHTNGYSLARKIFFEGLGMQPATEVPELGSTVASALLAVHRSYLKPVFPLVENLLLSAMAHITGGGFPGQPSARPARRTSTPSSTPAPGAGLRSSASLQDKGRVAPAEMLRVFNCGIGMVLIVPPARGLEVKTRLDASGEDWKQIGRVQKGERKVRFV